MDDAPNIAIFCDFENIAIGARDANFDAFDIGLALARLLDKGKIIVKKAYADWERYKSHRRAMHEAAFELIEIPHVSYSGKNSADIRLVVDALDLCYTKSHVDTFVVMSGDSDFSPLVSKLRENNKQVIGLGVKNSSSDLLIENCDDFIYYDDLVRMKQSSGTKGRGGRGRGGGGGGGGGGSKDAPKKPATKKSEAAAAAAKKPELPADAAAMGPPEGPRRPEAAEAPPAQNGASDADETARREEGIELVLDTVEALFQERDGNLWGSMVKQTIKRKRPTFSETYYGFRTFTHLLEEAQRRGLLEIQKDEKSGGYVIVSFGPQA